MRTVLLAIALAVLLTSGCGGGAEKTDPCVEPVTAQKSLLASAVDAGNALAADTQNGTRTTSQTDSLRRAWSGAVLTWAHVITNSPKCFEPGLVAQAQTALDQAKAH